MSPRGIMIAGPMIPGEVTRMISPGGTLSITRIWILGFKESYKHRHYRILLNVVTGELVTCSKKKIGSWVVWSAIGAIIFTGVQGEPLWKFPAAAFLENQWPLPAGRTRSHRTKGIFFLEGTMHFCERIGPAQKCFAD